MWKKNWETTKQHFVDWWKHDGLVIGMWGAPPLEGTPYEEAPSPGNATSVRERYIDPEWRAAFNHYRLAHQAFPADIIPVVNVDLGPGSLALLLGSEPGFGEDTIWFEPAIQNIAEPESLLPFRFDATNPWWQLTEATLKASVRLAQGKYMVGCPDLVENVDVLSSLREPQTLMMDMIERPEWVEAKVREITDVWLDAYQRIYDIIKQEDGSSAFGAFYLWGPGKTAKLQCDASAMFSPDMFQQFVVPEFTRQCAWLDHSLYHLDGTQAVCHLDALLAIDGLDAIEWTPQAGIETGGDARWFPLYRKILDTGKSVQVVNVKQDEIIPLLAAIGSRGVYMMTQYETPDDAERIADKVEIYR